MTGETGRQGRVTIKAVAKEAGVSVAAVSKVLRNAYGVSPAMRTRVQAAIDDLGYRPNLAARGMRGQSFTIGILLYGLDNPFIADVVDGIHEVTIPAGYKSLLGVGRAKVPIETNLIDTMIDYRMDGLVLIGPRLSPETLALYAPQIPLVCIGHHEPQAVGFDTVNSNDFAGAGLVVKAMIARGHRDIGMISLELGVDHKTNVSDIREAGYLAAMAEAGLAHKARIARVRSVDPAPDDPELRAWLQSPDRPRAVFCWSDIHAMLLVNIAAEMGIAIPDELAVAGYDNSRPAAYSLIGLASVDQDAARIGVETASLLMSRIGGRSDAVHALVTPTLVLRRSI
ncbi:MAG: LacI family DNA-binding transcriptional regulator [Rubellimicrobium sp.]|nr:LacI family DNA-binding transcriptional regulator [Rubellimicrobium sp.]